MGKDLNVINSHNTVNTKGVGQQSYISPEQLGALKDTTIRSDVFALGRLINFIMTKNPYNDKNIFSYITDKCTKIDVEKRYSNAEELYEAVKEKIKFDRDEELKEKIDLKIKCKMWDQEVENYVLQQTDIEILNNIKSNKNYYEIIYKVMLKNDSNLKNIMEKIYYKYDGFYRKFSDYDNLANLMYELITENINEDYKNLAIEILKNIAIDVGRYNAQILLNELGM